MNELATIKKELVGIDESKAAQIEAVFAPMVAMLKDFEGQYDTIMALEQSPDKCAKAKRLRLDIAKVRIEADKVRKIQKEEYLRAGNAIQAVYNILKFAVAEKEDSLKETETYYERIEAELTKRLQEAREIELSKYEVDGSTIDLGNMLDDVWVNFLTGTKITYETVKEAERKAEEDRLAQIEADRLERIRIEEENAALKLAQQKAEKERIAREKKLQEEQESREKIEREAQAKRDAERLAQEKSLQAERQKAEKERKRLADEAKAAQVAAAQERQRAAEAEARIIAQEKAAKQAAKEAEANRKAHEVECPKCQHRFIPEGN